MGSLTSLHLVEARPRLGVPLMTKQGHPKSAPRPFNMKPCMMHGRLFISYCLSMTRHCFRLCIFCQASFLSMSPPPPSLSLSLSFSLSFFRPSFLDSKSAVGRQVEQLRSGSLFLKVDFIDNQRQKKTNTQTLHERWQRNKLQTKIDQVVCWV